MAENKLANVTKEDQGVVSPAYADAIRTIKKNDEKRKDATQVRKPFIAEPKTVRTDALKRMHLSESLFEEFVENKPKKQLREHKHLNEGAGAGYNVKGIVDATKINKLTLVDVEVGGERNKYRDGFNATFDCDIDATVFNISADSYYHGGNLIELGYEDVPAKFTKIDVYFDYSMFDALDYKYGELNADRNYDDPITELPKEDIKKYLNGNIEKVKQVLLEDSLHGIQIDHLFGAGWLHVSYNGELMTFDKEISGEPYTYSTFIEKGDLHLIDEDAINAIDLIVQEPEDDFDIDESLKESKSLNEKGLTRAERYNRMYDKIWDSYKKGKQSQMDFLLSKGVTKEEIEELKQNTGLSKDALGDKLVELGLWDEWVKFDTAKNESLRKPRKLKEEYGFYKDEPYCEEIADDLERGVSAGDVDGVNWEITINGLKRKDFHSQAFYEYLVENISYPVRDGHLSYYGLDNIVYAEELDRFDEGNLILDLKALGVYDDSSFKNAIQGKDDLEFWTDYDVNFDVVEWEAQQDVIADAVDKDYVLKMINQEKDALKQAKKLNAPKEVQDAIKRRLNKLK